MVQTSLASLVFVDVLEQVTVIDSVGTVQAITTVTGGLTDGFGVGLGVGFGVGLGVILGAWIGVLCGVPYGYYPERIGGCVGAMALGLLSFWNVAKYRKLVTSDYVLLLERMGPHEFDEAAYISVEYWLRNRGKDEEADKVYLRMRSLEWRHRAPAKEIGKTSSLFTAEWRSRYLKWALLYLTGYGIRPLRVFLFWLALAVAAGFIFSSPKSVKLKISHGSFAVFVKTNYVQVAQPATTTPGQELITKTLSVSSWPAAPVVATFTNSPTDTNRWTMSLMISGTNMPGAIKLVQANPTKPEENYGLPAYMRSTKFLNSWEREMVDKHPEASDWNVGKACAMASRVALPMLPSYLLNDWQPSSEQLGPTVPFFKWLRPRYETVATGLEGFSWLLASLFALSVSGLIKARK
jgi:hypothetical protein